MDTPTVSVVILNYNYAHFVGRSLSSALDQTWPKVEVVVVDDCSTDNSREVIGTYAGRVKPVFQPQNGGHGAGMNAGFAASTGDVVIFLDADDFLYPDAAGEIVARRASGVAQYQFRLDLVNAEGGVIDTYPPRELGFDDGDVSAALLRSGRYATTVTSGLAFERTVLEQIMPMNREDFRQGGDGYLVTVAPLYGRVVTIETTLGAYCQHGGNHSQFGAAVAERSRWRLSHDAMRHKALREHARLRNLECDSLLWAHDPLHLEERAASLLLDPAKHPYPDDSRRQIAGYALASAAEGAASGKRAAIMRAWWWAVGYGPRSIARNALCWKLQAATRPPAVRWLARRLRALVSPTRATDAASPVRAANAAVAPSVSEVPREASAA